jgi:phosphatidylinositol-bisphosphatase
MSRVSLVSFDEEDNEKQGLLNLQMKRRLMDFCDSSETKIFCGTWNVCNTTVDKSDRLKNWILPQGFEPADIYAVAVQDMIEVSAYNTAFSSNDSTAKSFYWVEKITECLSSNTDSRYKIVLRQNMVGMMLVVLAKDNVYDTIFDPRCISVGSGMLGMGGDKGGVVIRMKVCETSLAFVCAHLRVDKGAAAGRSADVKRIVDGAVLPPCNEMPDKIAGGACRLWSFSECEESISLYDHDHIFWMGDLNYRISDHVISEKKMHGLVNARSYELLLDADELNIEKKKGNVFVGYLEGKLGRLWTY